MTAFQNASPNEPAVWHYIAAGQQVGPLTPSALGRLIHDRYVRPDTMVWRPGLANWLPAGSLQELWPALSTQKSQGGALGLTQSGLILFIVLLVCFWPLCWLPWVIDSMRAR